MFPRRPLDLTRPTDNILPGTRHPMSIVRNQIIGIFGRIGFTVAEDREIEDDWHNFSALNFPEEHPARDMQDTFFIDKDPDIAFGHIPLRCRSGSWRRRNHPSG